MSSTDDLCHRSCRMPHGELSPTARQKNVLAFDEADMKTNRYAGPEIDMTTHAETDHACPIDSTRFPIIGPSLQLVRRLGDSARTIALTGEFIPTSFQAPKLIEAKDRLGKRTDTEIQLVR